MSGVEVEVGVESVEVDELAASAPITTINFSHKIDGG